MCNPDDACFGWDGMGLGRPHSHVMDREGKWVRLNVLEIAELRGSSVGESYTSDLCIGHKRFMIHDRAREKISFRCLSYSTP